MLVNPSCISLSETANKLCAMAVACAVCVANASMGDLQRASRAPVSMFWRMVALAKLIIAS